MFPFFGFNLESNTPGSASIQSRVLSNSLTDLAANIKKTKKIAVKVEEDIYNVRIKKKVLVEVLKKRTSELCTAVRECDSPQKMCFTMPTQSVSLKASKILKMKGLQKRKWNTLWLLQSSKSLSAQFLRGICVWFLFQNPPMIVGGIAAREFLSVVKFSLSPLLWARAIQKTLLHNIQNSIGHHLIPKSTSWSFFQLSFQC